MPMSFVPLRAFLYRNGTFLLFDMYLELCVSMYMCEQQLLLSWCLLQTPCLFCIYQGTGRRESSFLKWHISIKKRKSAVCVCVCEWESVRVRGWNKLYSTLTGDHFSGQSWFCRLNWCWSVCLPVIPQAALCIVWFMHVLNSNKLYQDGDVTRLSIVDMSYWMYSATLLKPNYSSL